MKCHISTSNQHLIFFLFKAYLEAGADIIETNTFNGTSISQADYGLEHLAYRLNYEAGRLAKKATLECEQKTGLFVRELILIILYLFYLLCSFFFIYKF